MRTDLSHLPRDKQRELGRITELVREAASPEMVILFGSHARGDWVEDRHEENGILYEYVSDYDIMVVVAERREGDDAVPSWRAAERTLDKLLGPDVNAIAHGIEYLNGRLEEGHYFFSDIVKEGILLYDSGRCTLAEAKALDEDERRRVSKEHYEQWFPGASVFLKQFQYAFNDDNLKEAAFLLHQATERFYTAVLLVFTGQKPKTHNIRKLGKLAAAQVPGLIRVFPRAAPEDDERFKLLRRAYIDARYRPEYSITREDLEYLASRVRELKTLAEEACGGRIEGPSA